MIASRPQFPKPSQIDSVFLSFFLSYIVFTNFYLLKILFAPQFIVNLNIDETAYEVEQWNVCYVKVQARLLPVSENSALNTVAVSVGK